LDGRARCLYVYYRVSEMRLGAVVGAVRAMQARLCRDHPGLEARLLRRPEIRDGAVTVMETYEHVDGVDPALQAAIAAEAATALPPGLAAGRHVEVFEPLP
jgi:hypothetical protein